MKTEPISPPGSFAAGASASDAEAWPAGPDRAAGRANSERRSVTATRSGAAPKKKK